MTDDEKRLRRALVKVARAAVGAKKGDVVRVLVGVRPTDISKTPWHRVRVVYSPHRQRFCSNKPHVVELADADRGDLGEALLTAINEVASDAWGKASRRQDRARRAAKNARVAAGRAGRALALARELAPEAEPYDDHNDLPFLVSSSAWPCVRDSPQCNEVTTWKR